MNQTVMIAIVLAILVVVVLAVVLNRRLKIGWGDRNLEVGDPPVAGRPDQEVTATGKGTHVSDIDQKQAGTAGRQRVAGADGGKITGVKQSTTSNGGQHD